MAKEKAKILMLVEGAKTDVKLMNHLLSVFGIDKNHTVVSYNTNIYTLYDEMFADGSPENKDILQVLKSHETDLEKKKLFDENYSDILLIFDLDPQDSQYSADKIKEMTAYFVESSDMGKLYINYPMVESFYHMKSIPDNEYSSYIVTLDELKNHLYKSRVNAENRNHNYNKFAINQEECCIVIRQNIDKAEMITEDTNHFLYPDLTKIAEKQTDCLSKNKFVYVLCTCAFYIIDYNPNLLLSE